MKPAPPPPHAAQAANYVRPATEDGSVFVHQRPLTEAEAGELNAMAPPVPLVNAVLAFVAAVGVIETYVIAVREHDNMSWSLTLFGLIAYWSWRFVIRTWRARRRVAPDLRAGYVLIVRVRGASGELGAPEEYLPKSQRLWTADGEPSPWRKET